MGTGCLLFPEISDKSVSNSRTPQNTDSQDKATVNKKPSAEFNQCRHGCVTVRVRVTIHELFRRAVLLTVSHLLFQCLWSVRHCTYMYSVFREAAGAQKQMCHLYRSLLKMTSLYCYRIWAPS